ncbi:hypothetical protein KIW84_071271 [Lathyrus oleraceus]|uniref:VWFA domain-containing protein n=1 Tax=Pisum sativum TaxID=3888 RepID=A0A9D4VK32_PEA|nr:hypothetical protein KIW84_071270 [Pisum sativum]KAI5384196.1 hypothetical protein KIW84_071271 [Pisum sativum]
MEERAVGTMQATPVTTREKELHLQETQLQQSTGSLVDELRRQKMKNVRLERHSIITNNAISERNIYGKSTEDTDAVRAMEIKTYPEVSSVPRSDTCANFTVLVHLKATAAAAASTRRQNLSRNQTSLTRTSQTPRALFDLALQAVNSLVANGGTNIAEGLRKGAKIMEDRKEKNPVANIILLSDGQDNYTVGSSGNDQPQPNYHLLLPISISGRDNWGFQIPVHAFGFGADHDASSMHSISEISDGTFSFTYINLIELDYLKPPLRRKGGEGSSEEGQIDQVDVASAGSQVLLF